MGDCLRRRIFSTLLFALLLALGTLIFTACSSENNYVNDINSIGILSSESGDLSDSTEASEFEGVPEAKDGVLYFQMPGSSSSYKFLIPSSSSVAPEPNSSSSLIVTESSSSLMPLSSSAEPVSSSSLASSSSSVNSSPGENVDKWDWSVAKEKYLNPDIVYERIVDSRDGQKYYIVKIKDRWWMAQNLNYSGEEVEDQSWCYGDVDQYCEVLGRLYTWDAAKVACPEGWRLPLPSEWQELIASGGGTSNAGRSLKSKVGWFMDSFGSDANGTDSLGFSAFPTGWRGSEGKYVDLGTDVYFWQFSGGTYADYVSLYYADRVELSYHYKDMGFSVRCVVDVNN